MLAALAAGVPAARPGVFSATDAAKMGDMKRSHMVAKSGHDTLAALGGRGSLLAANETGMNSTVATDSAAGVGPIPSWR